MKMELCLSVFFDDDDHEDFSDADEFEEFMEDKGRGFSRHLRDEGCATGAEFLCDPRDKELIEQWKKDKGL